MTDGRGEVFGASPSNVGQNVGHPRPFLGDSSFQDYSGVRKTGDPMYSTRLAQRILFTYILCAATVSAGTPLLAATFPEFTDPNPAPGNSFGSTVLPLPTGNVVITAPGDDASGLDAGAVYLFNGSTGAQISTLRGLAGDQAGSGGAVALANGNYVIRSPAWHNGALADAGAVTFGNGITGVSGTVSAANSLVGSRTGDSIGSGGLGPVALPNGSYVVLSPGWDNGATVDAGAATWGNGTTGITGTVSVANSLVGSVAGDAVGEWVDVLTNGNYLVLSSGWHNGAIVNAGAVTWCNGNIGLTGTVSAANSLVGSSAGDFVADVTPLANGNYVVGSPSWDNGPLVDAGAATWGNGTTGITGTISAANSLVSSSAFGFVGAVIAPLTNGNYVVVSTSWDNSGTFDVGAATWGNGSSGIAGAVSAANSLVGSRADDRVGSVGVAALTNGNYVVTSPNWDGGPMTADAGAATWGNGTTGVVGAISGSNSLVGSKVNDRVGSNGVTALSNGNYVVSSPNWDNLAIPDAGAATWGNGTTAVIGVISAANSLVGDANCSVGAGVTALTNGNYVVLSPSWDGPGAVDAGAATWGNGATGLTGFVSLGNSLVGSRTGDFTGSIKVTALANGNYVVTCPNWDNGFASNYGAATLGSGATGTSGAISAGNSLVGFTPEDQVGSEGVLVLPNSNLVVGSPNWDNGVVANVGAATWVSGTTGLSGPVSGNNSLIGTTATDRVGFMNASNAVVLPTGDYVLRTAGWDNGALANAGAATWGNGTIGVSGPVSAVNSLVGLAATTALVSVVGDSVNGAFYASFIFENGGRVRVGPTVAPGFASATDIPGDQGGWVRLTFNRSSADDVLGLPPVTTYGIWRRVLAKLPARGVTKDTTAPLENPTMDAAAEAVRAFLPEELEALEVEGRLYVTSAASPPAEIAVSFPPGTWELVTSVPALQQAQYVVAVPTISNATPNDYVVTSHTTIPSVWYISNVVSAQSLDNLAPVEPTQFTAGYAAGQTNLQWAANPEQDVDFYRLYRGASAEFVPTVDNRIASPTTTSYSDPGPPGSYYKLSAVDVNGNESGFTLVTPQQTTGVDDGERVAFALEGARPNPARGDRLVVAFALPTGGPAQLELVDVSGRRVLSREVGSLGAGRHTLDLAAGGQASPGVYWLRLVQGIHQQTIRVAVTR